jgi:molybdopterin-guanine dinucleotide biosynthesis protein A
VIAGCTGVVLAGGASRRMGRDKAAIVLGGETLLQRTARVLGQIFPRVLQVGRAGTEAGPGGIAFLNDYRPARGPVSGIAAALAASESRWIFVAACDMPRLEAAFIEELWRRAEDGSDCAAIVPVVEGQEHPLCAFYAARLAAMARRAVDGGELSARAFAAAAGARRVAFAPDEPLAAALANVNTPEDLERAIGLEEGRR